jgi:hypothetical protein
MLAATDWMLRLGLGHRGSSSSSSSPPSSFSSSSKLSNAAGTQRIPDAVPPRTPDPTADASRSRGARRDAGVARYAADALVDARFNLQQSEIEVLRRDLRARSEELERASQFLVRQRAQISELQRDSIARDTIKFARRPMRRTALARGRAIQSRRSHPRTRGGGGGADRPTRHRTTALARAAARATCMAPFIIYLYF